MRPKKYSDNMPERAEKLCRECGLTIVQLATAFGVSDRAIKDWQHKYTEFAQAIQRGRDYFDSEKVEGSLLKRAMGYAFTEVTKKLRKWTEIDPETGLEAEREELVVTQEVQKHVPPETMAIIYWLNNRQSARWRQKVDLEHSGDINITVATGIERAPND